MSAQDHNPWQWRGGELAQVDGPRHWLSITYGIERVRHLEELAWRTRSSGLFEAKPPSGNKLLLRFPGCQLQSRMLGDEYQHRLGGGVCLAARGLADDADMVA